MNATRRAVMLWRASRDPARHALFLDFTIWGSAAHGLVMVIATPLQKGVVMTFVESIPLLVIAAALLWLRPRSSAHLGPFDHTSGRQGSRPEVPMASAPDFSLNVEGVRGVCPAGEVYAKRQMAARAIPVLTCEGPCIRGDIARLAGNLIANEVPGLARACHGEAFFVPRSSFAEWIRSADKVVMVDGCFLKCHGRVLTKLIPEDRVIHIDALPMYNKYTDLFSMEDVPEEERRAVARHVADTIIARLKETGGVPGLAATPQSGSGATVTH